MSNVYRSVCFAGGGLGAVARWLICLKISSHWGIMPVNVIGAFLIGCTSCYFERHLYHAALKSFVMTGFLGGFTTFSTYLLNFTALLNVHSYTEAFLYLIGSVVIGFIALLLGIKGISCLLSLYPSF
ncbi:MAG: CrcB family protein [Alphaproteobacteria bacterium]|nr:CrcB family protein [Alphaproteobacteria bacterium]